MNGPFQVAQATGLGTGNPGTPGNSAPARLYRLTKPLGDQAVVVNIGYDQKTKIDFSAIANEKITLVHLGDKLIILFDNKSTLTVEPFFDSRHDALKNLTIEVAPGREVTVGEFASLFPITTDQSVLPAAGDGNGNAQGSGAYFSSSAVDGLNSGDPLDLLGQEELGTFRSNFEPAGLTVNGTPLALVNAEIIFDEDGLTGGILGGLGDLDSTSNGPIAATGTLAHNYGSDGQGSLLLLGTGAPVGFSYTLSGGGTILTVSQFQNGVSVDVLRFSLSNTADGIFTITQLHAIDHPTAGTEDDHSFVFNYRVTDFNGDFVDGTLGLTVDDDSPVVGQNAPVAFDEDALPDGNLGGVNDLDNTTNGPITATGILAHNYGADQAGTVLLVNTGAPTGFTYTVDVTGTILTVSQVQGVVSVDVLRVVLTDPTSGNYTITQLAPINHATGQDENNQTFTFNYTVTDHDGDTAVGSLVLTVNDDTPIALPGNPGEGEGEGSGSFTFAIVHEDGLNNSQSVGNQEVFSTVTSVVITAADLASLVSFGVDQPGTFSLNPGATAPTLFSNGDPVTYSVTGNTLTASADGRTVFTLQDNGDQTFTFTLVDQLDHQGFGDFETLTINLASAFLATDSDGDSVVLNGTFNIQVENDIPVTASNTLVTVDEDDLTPAGNGDTSSPGDDGASVSPVTGTLQFLVGADESATVGFASLNSAEVFDTSGAAVKSGGLALTYLWDSLTNTLYATTDGTAGGAAFSIQVTDPSTGAYSFTLLKQLDHPGHDVDGANDGPETAYEDNITIDLTYTVADFDGDSATGTLSLSIDDDMPILVQAPVNLITNGDFSEGTFASAGFGGVAQPDGVTGWVITNSTFEPPASGGLQVERVFDNYLGMRSSTLGDMIDMGASPGNIQISQQLSGLTAGQTYAIQFEAGAPHPSTATLEILWNNVVIGTIDPTGPMTSYAYVVTATGIATSDQITFREVGQGHTPIPGQADEGYHGTYLANVSVIATAVVDEDGLTGPLSFGNNDSQVGDALDANTDGDTNEATATGNLNIAWGADNLDSATADTTTGPFNALVQDATGGAANRSVTFTDANVTVAGGVPLTSQGVTVTFELDPSGTVLRGMAGERTVFEVSLSDDDSGSFRFVLLDQLDHAANGNENDIALTFNYTATDSDGDAVDGKFVVSVDDDVPVFTSATAISRVVDEDDIDTPWSEGRSPEDGDDDGSTTEDSTGAAFVSGSLSSLVSIGADEPGTFGFSSDAIAKLTALGLFSKQTALGDGDNGKPLYYLTSAGGANEIVITGYEPSPQGNPVFSLTLNTVTGDYEFRLFDELIHVVGDGENTDLRSGLPVDGVQASVPYLNLGSIVTYTDRDGDTVDLSGKFTVTITDDVPQADIDIGRGSVTADESPGNQADDTTSNSVRTRFAALENSGVRLCAQRFRCGRRRFSHRRGFPSVRASVHAERGGRQQHRFRPVRDRWWKDRSVGQCRRPHHRYCFRRQQRVQRQGSLRGRHCFGWPGQRRAVSVAQA
jgi:T1SS-143 domain-containing protein